MKTKILSIATFLGTLFFLSCNKEHVPQPPPEPQAIIAGDFFNRFQPKIVSADIDGDGDIDIIVSGITKTPSDPDTMFGHGTKDFTDIDGDGDIDIIVSGLRKTKKDDIDGDGDIDIIVSGIASGGSGNDQGNTPGSLPDKIKWTWKDGGIAAMDDWEAPIAINKITTEAAMLPTKNNKLLSGHNGVSDEGTALTSDALFYINATYKGKQLKINPEKEIIVEVYTDKIISGNSLYWKKFGSNEGWANTDQPLKVNNEKHFYSFVLKSFGWFSIGKPASNSSPLTDIEVRIDDNNMSNLKGLDLWLVWENKNVIMKLNAPGENPNWGDPYEPLSRFLSGKYVAKDVPVGEKPILLALGTGKDGNLYISKNRIKIVKGGTYVIGSNK